MKRAAVATLFLFIAASPASAKEPIGWSEFKANRVAEAAANRLMIPKVLPVVIEDARAKYAEWQEAWSNHLRYQREAEAPASPVTAEPVSSSSSVWDAVAACEGGGNWGLVTTGNGYYFVLQFSPGTWLAYGGTQAELDAGVAPSPSRLIEVAERVLAGQGPGAWPNCFP